MTSDPMRKSIHYRNRVQVRYDRARDVRRCLGCLQMSYLPAGLQFHLIVDHQPPVPILITYTLDQVENPRLHRLLQKVYPYQFTTSWQRGSIHAFADSLSLVPLWTTHLLVMSSAKIQFMVYMHGYACSRMSAMLTQRLA